jgi:bacterioferritin
MGRPEASQELRDLLNQAIARELQVSIQYVWQHVVWSGVKGFAVKDELRSIGIAEMKHAEAIAERLNYLGGVPTTKPEPIFIGETLREQLEHDVEDEHAAIDLYNRIIVKARQDNDVVTERMFREILQAEEDHHDTFHTLLEEV